MTSDDIRRLFSIPEGVVKKYSVPAKVLILEGTEYLSNILIEEIWLYSRMFRNIMNSSDILYSCWEYAPSVIGKDSVIMTVDTRYLVSMSKENIRRAIKESIFSITRERRWQ
jgi:hypothetical protein